MAGRRRDTIQIRVHINTNLSALIDILSEVQNKPKGIILEELIDEEKVKKYKEKISLAIKKAP